MAQGLARVFNGTAFLPAKPWYKQEKILELKAGETHSEAWLKSRLLWLGL